MSESLETWYRECEASLQRSLDRRIKRNDNKRLTVALSPFFVLIFLAAVYTIATRV